VARTFWMGVCFAFATLNPSGRQPVPATQADGHVPVAPTGEGIVRPIRSDRPAFRLGDAGKPFGWSTVIGDFNTDGQPDVAVADRIARRTRGYVYRLEFAVSGQAPHSVTFESTHDAITVSVADVDRDNDLDIIISTPLSGEMVGIWLNDGQGHFTADDGRRVLATIRPLQSLSPTDPVAHVAAFEESPRRADDALPTVFRATLGRSPRRSILPRSHSVRSPLPSIRTGPRAPPSASLHVLS
jgi:hypothetical protein